jgi:hypothetical protein
VSWLGLPRFGSEPWSEPEPTRTGPSVQFKVHKFFGPDRFSGSGFKEFLFSLNRVQLGPDRSEPEPNGRVPVTTVPPSSPSNAPLTRLQMLNARLCLKYCTRHLVFQVRACLLDSSSATFTWNRPSTTPTLKQTHSTLDSTPHSFSRFKTS